MRFQNTNWPHSRNRKGDIIAATTGTQTGSLWFAKCAGNEAYGSDENQALRALKNMMTKQRWRVVK
jgi:hypothetical protein